MDLWGYTAWNDISVRDKYFQSGRKLDSGPLVWALQKNGATGNAAGPWTVVEDDIDVQDLAIRTFVSDEKRQDSTTANLLHSFQRTYDHLSSYFGLGARGHAGVRNADGHGNGIGRRRPLPSPGRRS